MGHCDLHFSLSSQPTSKSAGTGERHDHRVGKAGSWETCISSTGYHLVGSSWASLVHCLGPFPHLNNEGRALSHPGSPFSACSPHPYASSLYKAEIEHECEKREIESVEVHLIQ